MRVLAIATILWASTAQADEAIWHFEIGPQSLVQALLIYGEQASLSITVSDEIHNRTTPGIAGSYTRDQAIEKLLIGTGLVYEWVGENAIAVTPPPANVAPQEVQQISFRVQPTLEEIVVTARRREEVAQAVPISLTVFTQDDLSQLSIERVEDLQYNTPQLFIGGRTSGRHNVGYSLRAIPSRGGGLAQGVLTQDPAVGIYIGEVVQARQQGTNHLLFDLENVQVIHGPVGTLFGRNSLAGAILFTPRRPSDELEAELTVTLGSESRHDTLFVGNLPIREDLAFRIGWKTARRDGYTNLRGGRDLDDENVDALRAQLLWQPTERLETLFLYDLFVSDEAGQSAILTEADPAGLATRLYDLATRGRFGCVQCALREQNARGIRNAVSDGDYDSQAEVHGLSNVTTFEVTPEFTIKNILGFRDISSDDLKDLDGVDIGILGTVDSRTDVQQWSNEFQLLGSPFDGRLDWIAGLYYFMEKGENDTLFHSFRPFSRSPQRRGVTAVNTAYSLFLQGTYEFPWLEALSFTGGWRWTKDKREMTMNSEFSNPTLGCRLFDTTTGERLNPCAHDVSDTFREPTHTLSLEYQWTDDLLVYATHRKGYRSGGFNNIVDAIPEGFVPFDQETVRDYEVGFKADWRIGDMPIRTNAAFFYARYDDIQTDTQSLAPSGNPVQVIGNANEATIKGMELEIALSPIERLELFGNYGYTRGEFDTFSSSVIGTTDLSGVHFSQPRYTTSFRLRYRLPIGTDNGEVAFSASYYRRSKTGETLAQDQKSRIDAYDIMNLRLDWLDVMGWPVDAAIVLTNAGDEEYVEGQFAVNPSAGIVARSFGPPRQWGLELSYRF